jgi:hypothetical protein
MANAIRVKSVQFAIVVVNVSRTLQVVQFHPQASIALKEANETAYWIELHAAVGYLPVQLGDLSPKVTEILRLLTAIINSTKRTARMKPRRPS